MPQADLVFDIALGMSIMIEKKQRNSDKSTGATAVTRSGKAIEMHANIMYKIS